MKRALLLAIAAVAIAPGAASAAPVHQPDDPLRALAGDSPLCASPATATARQHCEASGAVEHAYPVDSYRFDWHIDTGITKIDNNLAAMLQWLVSMLWQLVLWAANAILLVFQWAFSLDLLGSAMQPVRATLNRLHTSVFGHAWFVAAITLLGLWGLWNGILRRRTLATAGSLGAALLMMAGTLALIAHPDTTIGSATRALNQTKLSILGGVTHGSVRNSQRSLEDTSEEIFNTIVLRPWCAVQFGDVKWCLKREAGAAVTRADQWLRLRPGGKAREIEYKLYAEDDFDMLDAFSEGDDDEVSKEERTWLVQDAALAKGLSDADRAKVRMQEQDRTLFRVGLILLILVGVIGWVVLLGWLAAQSLFQALLGLVLVLVAPVVLLAPAFGDGGRQVFMRWATRLLATVVSGALYALLLAVTLTVATLLGELSVASTWLAAWLLQMLFLWGIFFKRKDILAWVSNGGHQNPRMRMTEAYAAKNLLQSTTRQATAPAIAVGGAPVRMIGAVGGAGLGAHRERRADRDQWVQQLAGEQLDERGRQQLQTKYDAYHARLTTHDEAARKLPEMRRRRDKVERQLQAPNLSNQRRSELQRDKGKLTGQIKALEPKLMPKAEEGVARKFIESSDRSLVESGQRFSGAQVAVAVAGLRHDVEANQLSGAPEHAWRAQSYRPGVPETELAKLPERERTELEHRIEDDIRRDRALFAALPEDPRQERPTTARRRAAAQVLQDDLGRKPVVAAQREQRAQRLAQGDGGPLHNVNARLADRRARRSRVPSVPAVAPSPAQAAGRAVDDRVAHASEPPPPPHAARRRGRRR